MITEDYVSFETAKLLKEKGFDEPCSLTEFDRDAYMKWVETAPRPITLDALSAKPFRYSVPSIYVAMKWLREMHHLQICISSYSDKWKEHIHGWQFLVKKLIFTEGLGWNWDDSLEAITDKKMSDDITYATYEEACKSAIKYTLENLIA